jgi:benzoyl-CoA reductase/2-hydroxyglutaryl-CoA dehydratase subunit BcrC/BadD/HgdB
MRVFLTSPWIPAEWVRAHGLETRGIWFADRFRRESPPLGAGVCAFAEDVVRFAAAQPDAAVVFSTACDQLRRGFDESAFGGSTRGFLFNLPATPAPAARQIYSTELDRLGRFLRELGGVSPTSEILRREMSQTDEARRRLREAAPAATARSFAKSVARFHDDGGFSAPLMAGSKSEIRDPKTERNPKPEVGPGELAGAGLRTSDFPAVPLALVGGPLAMADWTLIDAIEDAGGCVALNATLSGERSLAPAFGEGADLLTSLADGYFENIADVFRRPNTRLYTWLKPRLLSRRARGIVLWCFTGCDLWRAEGQSLREVLGLPVLLLEAGDVAGISPRDANRLQAFVETLK